MICDDIVEVTRGYVDTPFRHQGRVPGEALDCAGTLVCSATECGLRVIDIPGYSRRPALGLMESTLDAQPCLRRVYRTPICGDLLLMKFTSEPQHVALCAGETLIHAYEAVGKVCEHGFSDEWRDRVVRVYEFIEASE